MEGRNRKEMNKKLGRGRIGKKIMAVLLCFIMLGQDVAFAAEAVRTGNESSSQIVQVDSGEGELVDKSPNSEVEIGDVNSDSKTDRNEGSSSEDNSAGEDSSSGSGDNQETNSESSSLPDSSSSQPDTSSDSSVDSSDNSDSSSDAGNLSLIHISEPTRLGMISYAVFCLKKKKKQIEERTAYE